MTRRLALQISTFVLATCFALVALRAQSPGGFDVQSLVDSMSNSLDTLELALEEHDGDTSDPLFAEEIDRIANLIQGVNYLTEWASVPVFEPALQAIEGFRSQASGQSYVSVSFIIYVVRGSIENLEVLGLLDPQIMRGDANSDSLVDVTDVVLELGYLYLGGEKPACVKAADTNDDGAFDIGDPVALLTSLFVSQSPDPNFAICARDTTQDSLSCDVPSCP